MPSMNTAWGQAIPSYAQNGQMIRLGKKDIDSLLPKVEKGLEQYCLLQQKLNKCQVNRNSDFQKEFTRFYRVRRNQEWRDHYFDLLESMKKKPLNFEKALQEIYQQTGRHEASFASKLIATINPDTPVIDSIVLKNVGLKLPYYGAKNRLRKIVEIHSNLKTYFRDFSKKENGKYLIKRFQKTYPRANITDIKMIDLVLWQKRVNKA